MWKDSVSKNKPHQIAFTADQPMPPTWESVLLAVFPVETVQAFKAHGVKLKISATTPHPRPKKPKAVPTLPEGLVEELKAASADHEKTMALMENIKGPQLLLLGQKLNLKLPKGQKPEHNRHQIADVLRSEHVWKGIAGVQEKSPPSPENNSPQADQN